MSYLNSIFSPLGKEYCTIYYAIMVVSFVQLVVVVIGSLVHLFSSKKNMMQSLVGGVTVSSISFVEYILARLAYSICTKAL
jgi:hypothetical protein